MPSSTLLISLAALASHASADFWLGSYVASYPNGVYGAPGGIDRSGGCFIESGPDPTCDSPGVGCDWVYAGGSSNFPNYCNTQLNCTWPNPGTVVHIESTGQDEACGKSTYGVNGIDPPPDGTYYGQIVDSDGPNGSGTAYGDCYWVVNDNSVDCPTYGSIIRQIGVHCSFAGTCAGIA